MANRIQHQVGNVTIEVAQVALLDEPAEAILLSSNNDLRGNPKKPLRPQRNWATEIQERAGPAYRDECVRLSRSPDLDGPRQGTAVAVPGADLATGRIFAYVIHAITIIYRPSLASAPHARNRERIRATPEVVRSAVKAGLELAEQLGLETVATYLMATRPGFATKPPADMAAAMCAALVQYAHGGRVLRRVVLCEADDAQYKLACTAMREAAE